MKAKKRVTKLVFMVVIVFIGVFWFFFDSVIQIVFQFAGLQYILSF